MHIKDESKVIDNQTVEGRTTYILNDGVYLKEVFDCLPCGIINKSETGMGATTLELISDRNSIIVEPTKITASSKAFKYKDKALYVGTPTKLHPQQTKLKDIKAYIEDESKQPKKIVVVADSLYKVIEAIGESVYQNYHLFLDEIDSFQMDSTFRDSMEVCLDYYKRFDVDKRLMVSATLVEFSDPELKDEPYTTFKYQNPTARTISLIHCGNSSSTGNFLGCVYEQIKSRAKQSPGEKVMIAFNSVSQSQTLASDLITNGILSKDEVGILCSVSNRNELGDLYVDLGDEELPRKVNFVTSAYFTGYDIKEPYHLISVSGVQSRVHLLSDKKLKQIAGRCRGTLHSETIIYETGTTRRETVVDLALLKEAAEKEILAIRCLESNYDSNLVLKGQLDKIRKLVIEQTLHNEFRLVRMNIEMKNVISFLNIDANLENQRVSTELYQSPEPLKNLLEWQGHTVTFSKYTSATVVNQTDLVEKSRVKKIKDLIETLRLIDPTTNDFRLLGMNLNSREKQVYDVYAGFYLYIDREQLLNKIEEVAVDKDSRALKNLRMSAEIAVLPLGHQYLRRVREHITVDHQYTNNDLVKAWNEIFQSTGLHRKYTDNEGVKALKWTKLHFDTKNLRKPYRHRIISPNPFQFTVVQYLTDKNGTISDTLKKYFE